MAKLVPTSTFDYGAKFPSISKQSKGKLQYLEKQLFIHGFAAAKAALRIGEEAVAARKILVEQEGLTAKEHIAWCSASSRVHESYIYKCMRMYESFGDVPNIGLGPRGMMMLIENGDKDAIDKAKKKANGVSMSIPQVEKLIHDVDKAKVKSGKKLEAPTKKKTAKKKTPPAQKPKDRMTDKACAKCGANVYEENKQFGWVCVNCDTPHGFTKKDLQAPEEEKPTDDYGTQMPAAIARIFADPSPASQLQLLRKVQKWAKGRKTQEGAYLNVANVLEAIDEAISQIEASVPYAVCPVCLGKKCDRCRKAGFMPEWDFDNAKEE